MRVQVDTVTDRRVRDDHAGADLHVATDVHVRADPDEPRGQLRAQRHAGERIALAQRGLVDPDVAGVRRIHLLEQMRVPAAEHVGEGHQVVARVAQVARLPDGYLPDGMAGGHQPREQILSPVQLPTGQRGELRGGGELPQPGAVDQVEAGA